MDTTQTVGFLGLGALGMPIAENLLASGVALRVWNRTASKAAPLVSKGASLASSPAEVSTRGGTVFSILWDDASLEQLVQSEGFLSALGPDGVHVSMTTVTPAAARRVAALHAEHGSHYVEAPIFGVPPQAVARKLTVCLAGPVAAKQCVRPLLEAMGAERIFDFGEQIGAATATKLAGNFMIISGLVAIHEVFNVLRGGGFDPKPSLEMLTTTLLSTPSLQRAAGNLLSGKAPATSLIPQKDVGLFQQLAESSHTAAPLAEQLRALLTRGWVRTSQ